MPHTKSYLGFPCEQCRQPLVALTIPRETETPKLEDSAVMRLQCPGCGWEGHYPAIEIRRYEAEQLFGAGPPKNE